MFEWQERFQTITHGPVTWFLNGAYNDLSLNKCAEWFARNSRYGWCVSCMKRSAKYKNLRGIVISGHFSAHRDPASLSRSLAEKVS